MNLPVIIEEQNRRIENLVIENLSLQKTMKENKFLLDRLQRKIKMHIYGVEEPKEEEYDGLKSKIIDMCCKEVLPWKFVRMI